MRSEQSSEGVTLTAGCFVLVFAGEYILQEREPASGGGDSGCEDDADSSTTASSSSASTNGANSSAYSSLDKALGLVHFDSTDFAEVKNCSRLVCFLFGCFFCFCFFHLRCHSDGTFGTPYCDPYLKAFCTSDDRINYWQPFYIAFGLSLTDFDLLF